MARHCIFLLTLCYYLKLVLVKIWIGRNCQKPTKISMDKPGFFSSMCAIFCLLSQWAVQSWLCQGIPQPWNCSRGGYLGTAKGTEGKKSILQEAWRKPGSLRSFQSLLDLLSPWMCNIAPWALCVTHLALPVRRRKGRCRMQWCCWPPGVLHNQPPWGTDVIWEVSRGALTLSVMKMLIAAIILS